ncbi:condensation domain-containing protein [Streptomyces orinoci]|uniref:Condensation domain-containing protein n=1 Tax=Streptomyces orinoci TaxID=67339 RepID=A0ABV3K2T4_STRON|nr:condensation domain-containing protein [Streptomyces orinoci]
MSTAPDTARQEALLARARGRRNCAPAAAPAADGPAPLSHAQHRMWLMDRLGQDGALYNVPFATRLRGAFQPEALAEALTGLVGRHTALRTRYPVRDGEPYQDVLPPVRIPVRTVRAAPEDAPRLLREEAQRPFDLAAGPLPRALHLRHSAEEHTVLLTFHHIAIDGGSLDLVAAELADRYAAAPAGGEPEPEQPAPRYADFARAERAGSAGLEAGLAYWCRHLAGARPLALPGRPGGKRGEGRVIGAALPPGTVEGLRAAGRAHRATLFTVALAAAFAALRSVTGEEDLVIGCASSHRDRAAWRELVGLCVNTLPLRPDLSGARDFATVLDRVRDELLTAQRHRQVPFDLIVERLGAAARDAAGNPLVGVTADVLPEPVCLRLPGMACEPVEVSLGTAKFGLGLFVETVPEPRCLVQYDPARLDEAAARELLSAFAAVLVSAAGDPARALPAMAGSPAGNALAGTALTGEALAGTAPAAAGQDAREQNTPGQEGASAGATAAVIEVFAGLLGQRPGPEGDFFLLGGHSLLAVRVADRLRERFGAPLTGLDVLEHRTPRALAALLEERVRRRSAARAARPAPAARAGTVLVTGGTGGVGAFVLRELAALGRPVRALARPESAHLVAGDGVEVAEGDLADPDSLRAAVRGVDFVIHAACTFTSPEVDTAAMRTLLEGRRRGSFVFVSSVDAYGRPSVAEVGEGAPSEEPLSSYGRAKLECERMLLEAMGAGDGASVVRAPIVWGPHDRLRDQLRWGATGALYQAALAGDPVVLPPAGALPPSGEDWSGAPWVHAAALARVLVHCLQRPAGGVVNAIGGHVGWAEFAAELIRLLDSPSEIRPSPEAAPGLLHRHRYRAEALAELLVPRPGEDWRSAIAAMLRG